MCPHSRTRIFSGVGAQHAGAKRQAGAAFCSGAGKGCAAFSGAAGMRKENHAGKKRWQKCHAPQKRKFLSKKRKKARLLLREIFCDCFCAPVDVLYYGCRRNVKPVSGI